MHHAQSDFSFYPSVRRTWRSVATRAKRIWGPQDAITEGITDLLGAFSPLRLTGVADPLPPYYLEVPEYYVRNLPQKTGYGCADLGIIITDRAKGIVNQIPTDFNPRPDTNPTPTK